MHSVNRKYSAFFFSFLVFCFYVFSSHSCCFFFWLAPSTMDFYYASIRFIGTRCFCCCCCLLLACFLFLNSAFISFCVCIYFRLCIWRLATDRAHSERKKTTLFLCSSSSLLVCSRKQFSFCFMRTETGN